jgi:hypothetical protein
MTRRRGPGPTGVILASVGAFTAVFAGIAFQLAEGRDPALGAGQARRPTVAAAPRRILVRRVVVRRVIVHVVPAEQDAPVSQTPAVTNSAPIRAAVPPPVRSAVPAPAPAQAPAPPPPAPVTRTS